MDFHVFFRPQPWLAELRGGGRGPTVEQTPWLPQQSRGGSWLQPLCHPALCSQPLGFCLIDSLVPVQAVLSLNSLATVLFCFWLAPLFLTWMPGL